MTIRYYAIYTPEQKILAWDSFLARRKFLNESTVAATVMQLRKQFGRERRVYKDGLTVEICFGKTDVEFK